MAQLPVPRKETLSTMSTQDLDGTGILSRIDPDFSCDGLASGNGDVLDTGFLEPNSNGKAVRLGYEYLDGTTVVEQSNEFKKNIKISKLEVKMAKLQKRIDDQNVELAGMKEEILQLKVRLNNCFVEGIIKDDCYEQLSKKCKELESSKELDTKIIAEARQKVHKLAEELKAMEKVNNSLNEKNGRIKEMESQNKHYKEKLAAVELEMSRLSELKIFWNSAVSNIENLLKETRVIDVE